MSTKLDEWKVLPRLMMLVTTIMYIRCLEWAMSQPDLSVSQAGLISVVTGLLREPLAYGWVKSPRLRLHQTRLYTKRGTTNDHITWKPTWIRHILYAGSA